MDTSPVICAMEGWSQGGLGLLLTASALIFAVGLMVYLRYYMGIVFVLVGAIALYYGWPVLEDIFNFHPNCVVVNQQFALEEGYANNTAICQRNLLQTDNQTGEDCSCNGQSATAQCVTYASVCDTEINAYTTAYNTCSCTNSNVNQSAIPTCQTLSQQVSYTQPETGGNSFSLNASSGQVCVALTSGNGTTNPNVVQSDYASCMSTANGSFSGCVNITGTAQVGYNCGGNSGFCGSGNEILPENEPPTACGPNGQGLYSGGYLPAGTQIGTGQPIVYSGGTFSGGPITDYYASSTGQLMTFQLTPDGSCVKESLNGVTTGEFCE